MAGFFGAAAGVGTDSAASISGVLSAPAALRAATSATPTGGELQSEGVHAPLCDKRLGLGALLMGEIVERYTIGHFQTLNTLNHSYQLV